MVVNLLTEWFYNRIFIVIFTISSSIKTIEIMNRISTVTSLLFICLGITMLNKTAGADWVQQESGTHYNLNDVTANHSNIDNAWVCGNHGILLYTSDGGQTWQTQISGTTLDLHSLAYIENIGTPVIAVGDSGIILQTLDSGATWQRETSPTTENLRCLSDDGLSIVGDHGTVLIRDNLNDAWEILPCPTTQRLNAVSGFFAPLLVSGENGLMMRKFNSSSWEIGSTPTTAALYGIPMFSISNMVVGDSGLILRSSDFGLHWSRGPSPVTENLRAVEYSSNNASHVYAVGNNGTIIKSTDDGISWMQQESRTTQHLYGVFFYLDDNNGWVVGDSGTILRTHDGGAANTNVGTVSIPSSYQEITLNPNYPNPFNPITTISFTLPHAGEVKLAVYDVLGRNVGKEPFASSSVYSAGEHRVTFDGADLSSGIYFVRMEAGKMVQTRKMILLR
jgi:photosystem II stability/assembly factor-like uncharacterized protein